MLYAPFLFLYRGEHRSSPISTKTIGTPTRVIPDYAGFPVRCAGEGIFNPLNEGGA